jgi:beta-glucosidase
VTDLGWEIYPEGLTRVLTEYHERFGGPIYITENGAADANDSFRCRFIYDHLAEVVRSGLPVERYYHWTFMDNWEWHEGQTTRFGLVGNDFRTQERTVRESARFYADVIANRGVTEEAYQRWVAPQMYRTNA